MPAATPRHPKRVCQVCLQYDDHPRIELLVTPDGPLGLHPASSVAKVSALLGPLLPPNMVEIEARLRSCGDNVAAQEQVYLDMIPDVEQYDAARAFHSFLHPCDFGAHMDCYMDDVPEVDKPQLAVNAWAVDVDPTTGELVQGEQVSWEDTRKIRPSSHALEQVGVLKGDDLRAHLIADPNTGRDHGHGAKAVAR